MLSIFKRGKKREESVLEIKLAVLEGMVFHLEERLKRMEKVLESKAIRIIDGGRVWK